jgi:lysosomal acid lipase/cholesteryl ester hydrolase
MATKQTIVAICLMLAVLLPEARSAIYKTPKISKTNFAHHRKVEYVPEAKSGVDQKAADPDAGLTTPELIVKYGYPAESHTVQTEDGYILTMHRIPYGKGGARRASNTPVLLQHGLLSSSADWVISGPGKALAYLLADAGYDVWLGNARGNTYSRKHVTLSPSNGAFWDFSWHEMGTKDLPTVIDYILQKTGADQIFYAGHSMGTTMFYVLCTERPEYNSKIKAMFSLAPIAFMPHLKSPLIQMTATIGDQLGWLLDLMGIYEFLPSNELLSLVGQALCNQQAITVDICANVLFIIAGFDSAQLNKTLLPAILGHVPAGAATKQILHYGQEVQSAHFRQYDYGMLDNMFIYGQFTPPDYDLRKLTAPVALYYSENDWLAAIVDVEQLASKLPNLLQQYLVPLSDFNHLDYLWAIDADTLVYKPIIEKMNSL